MLPRTLLLGFLVSCLCLPGLGCGMMSSGTGLPQVSGTVTLDGEPLEDGRIVFRDPAGVASGAGGKIQNGQFSLEVTPGSKQIEITARREVPGKFDESNPGEKIPILEQYVPARYNTKTELEKEIQSGDNEFAFELTSEK